MPGFNIAIIGAGPAGLSAGGRAAERDRAAGARNPTYVLLEGFSQHAKTIQRYQKGKHVMAEPGFLDLRSDMKFGAGKRETILQSWGDSLEQMDVNIQYGCDVTKITGSKGNFRIQMSNGQQVAAAHIVLAIGLEGNPRKL